MRIKLPNEFKSATVYVLANLFSRGLAIITVPIFTRIMTTEQIGIVTLFTSWFALISAFSTLSLTSGGFSLAMKEYKGERYKYVSSVLFLTTIIAFLLAIVYFINSDFWEKILGLSKPLIGLMIVGLVLAPARDFWLAKERYEYKYKLAAAVTICSALIASVLSISVVIWANKNGVNNTADFRLFSTYAIIYGIDGTIFLYLLLKGKCLVNKEFWKFSLKLSLPLVGYSVSTQILNVSDRMMIDALIGKSEVGIYGTLYTVSSLSIMIWTTINASFVPYLFENIDNRTERIKEIANILLFVYSGVAVMITFFSPEIVLILATDEYLEAKAIMPPIAAGVFMISVSNLYSNILVYYKKTTYIMYASIIAALLNVILNLVFISKFGYMAAAYTTLFSYIVLAALEYLWAQSFDRKMNKEKDDVYDNKAFLFLSVLTIVLCMCALPLYRFYAIRYIAAIAVGSVYLLIIYKNKGKITEIKKRNIK